METRQFLYNVRSEWREIGILKSQISALEASLLPAGIAYDKDKVQTTPTDQMSEKMTRLVDYKRELGRQLERLARDHERAQVLIDTLEDSRERQVLVLYFLSIPPRSIEQTAREIGYTRQHTYRLFERALAKLRNNVTLSCDTLV